jgi:small subunit ribosomal protein S18
MFCAQKIAWVDYKDTNLLRRFITDRGKIKARTNTGTCAQHQRDVAMAIKTSRELALLPYLVRTLAADKGGPRRGRGPGGRPGERPQGGDEAATAETPEIETVVDAVEPEEELV